MPLSHGILTPVIGPREWDEASLLQAARLAAQSAYAPYSGYAVGAAILTRSGQTITGCNVENASFGLTVCAERVAVCSAVTAGEREFVALALCTPEAATPCGACRQVLAEFSSELPIIISNKDGSKNIKYLLSELLPDSFFIKQNHRELK